MPPIFSVRASSAAARDKQRALALPRRCLARPPLRRRRHVPCREVALQAVGYKKQERRSRSCGAVPPGRHGPGCSGVWPGLPSRVGTGRPSRLKRQAGLDPTGPHFERVLRRYWQARLGLDEAKELVDSARRSAEVNKLSEIALGAPFNWTPLAYWKAAEVDEARGSALRQEAGNQIDLLRAGASSPSSYLVEREIATSPVIGAGALLRAGMEKQARKELIFALGEKPHNRWSRLDALCHQLSRVRGRNAPQPPAGKESN